MSAILQKLLLGLCLLLSASLMAQAPANPPFVCDGDFFLSLGVGGAGTGFFRVQSDSLTGALTFNGFSPGNGSGATVNAMGYRVTDNYIYGVNPNTGAVYRVGADGIAVNVANPAINTTYTYVAGDVTADGNYLVILGHQGGSTQVMVTIDLFSGNYATTSTNLTTTTPGNVFTADMAIDPFTGVIYGYDASAQRLITIDLTTGTLDNSTFLAGQGVDIFGALYFDSFGDLHGYGRPDGGSGQNSFYDIDILTGIPTFVTTGPTANSNDGCSCPFSIEMNHWVSPSLAQPCDTLLYYIEVANNSGGDKTGTELRTQLPVGVLIDQILYNPFPGTISSGVGTNLLWLTNATIPVGIDTLVLQGIAEALPYPISSPVRKSQARLYGLPTALGDSVLSDDPFTVPDPDSARWVLEIDTMILLSEYKPICPGDSVVLDASTLPANDWIWNDGFIGPTRTVTQSGSYVVYASACSVWIQPFFVQHLPTPPVQVSSDTTICQGDKVLFQATGATTYEWFRLGAGSQGTGPVLNFNPGSSSTYFVVGTGPNGCTANDTVSVTIQAPPVAQAGPNRAFCYYDEVKIGGINDPGLSFSWSPGLWLDDSTLMQPTFTGSQPGVYTMTLTVTDSLGCTATDPMLVQVLDFQLSLTTQDVDCYGNDNGQASLQVLGSAPYQFFWTDNLGLPLSNGVQSNLPLTLQNLEPGGYQALVIDQYGCQDSVAFSITEPASPLISAILNSQDVDCFGNANGALVVGGSGGTAPYQYSLDGGFSFQASGSFTGLGGSNYTLTTRDANGCLSLAYDTITSPTGLYGNVSVKKNINCFGANNGALTLFGAGGTGPYSLTLDGINYVNGLLLDSLGPGVDTVRLVDANGCEVPIPFEIFEPTPLLGSSVWARNIDCFGHQTGELAVAGTGGSRPYRYSLDGINFLPDSLFQQLPAATYAVVIQDDSLCQIQVPVTLTEPPALMLSTVSQQSVDCFGNATGAFQVGATGGTAPYLYQWDSLAFSSTTTFGGLTAGDYFMTVQDDSSCTASLLVQITEPPLLTLGVATQGNVTCFGDASGFVRLVPQGGTAPFQYSRDSLSFQADARFSQLGAGKYSFWVRDANGCSSRVDTDISEPSELLISKVDLDQIDCFGNDNGQVSTTVRGGIAPYQYSLNGISPQTSSSFANLPPGQYLLTVADDSACTVVYGFSIIEPPLLEISASHTDVRCYGFADGTATVEINGGTPTYAIAWETRPTQQTMQATGLGPGVFPVIVRDRNGCEARDTVRVFEPDTLTLAVVPGSIVEAYCDWPNGQAAVVSSGGLGDHVVQWIGPSQLEGFSVDQLLGGTYAVSVTDGNGCVTTIPVLIPDTPPAVPDFVSTPDYADSILFSVAQRGIQFLNQSQGAVAYHWEFGDGGQSSEENPQYFYAETGLFPVTLTAYNAYFECPTDTVVWLSIIPDGDLYLPNAFSPNGDGINDLFQIYGEGFRNFELQIFNRWGERLALFNDPSRGWDGRNAHGQAVPEGVYVFRVRAVLNDGATVDRGGTVTLVR